MTLQKSKMSFFLLGFIFLFFFFSPLYSETIPNFDIMTEEWKPYNFKSDGVVKGISTDILILILEKIGSTQGLADIKIYPWSRAYEKTQRNPNTILFTTTRTKEREELFKWVGPIFEIEFSLYAKKNRKIKINSPEDLKKFKIGTLRDDAVEQLLIKNMDLQLTDFDRVSANIMNTKKLSSGRIDLAAQSKVTTINTAKEAGIDPDIFEPVLSLDKKSMYYAFNRKTDNSVIVKFQTAFDDIKNQGKLAEIFLKYGEVQF